VVQRYNPPDGLAFKCSFLEIPNLEIGDAITAREEVKICGDRKYSSHWVEYA
jgi:hypothetical protein